VEEFYSAGASEVLIGDIEENEGKNFREALLVVFSHCSRQTVRDRRSCSYCPLYGFVSSGAAVG
jgi:hypothetical protein